METEKISQILSVSLIICIIILFILVIVLIYLWLKKKVNTEKHGENKTKKDQVIKSSIKEAKVYSTEDVKKFMEFEDIKDNMIVQQNGKKLIMVMKCQGINYDLMSSIEKVSVEQGFIQFLNTLSFPIQLYIQSRKVNLEESIINYNKRLKNIEAIYNKAKLQYEQALKSEDLSTEKIKEIKMEYIKNKNLYEYTKDIIANTEKMSLNKNILTKNYYIAISYYPDNSEELFKKEELIDMAFSELYTNAQAILRTLSVCGVVGKVLDSAELADLLYVAYNRDASEIYGIDKAIKSGYDSLYSSAPDVIEKKIQALDKLINERAVELANQAIETVTFKNRRLKELEEREKTIDEIIAKMAKNKIMENKGYVEGKIVEESINEVDKISKIRKKKGV